MLWWFAQTTLIAGALAVLATVAGRRKRLGAEARHALWLVVLIKLAIPPFVAWPWSVPDAWPSRVGPTSAPVVIASMAPPVVEATPTIPDVPALPPPDPPPVSGPPPSPEEVLAAVEGPGESQLPPISDFRPVEPKPEISTPAPEPQAPASEAWNLKFGIWNWDSALLALWLAGSVVVVARRVIKVARFHRSLRGSRDAPAWLVEEARAIGERVGVRPPPVLATSSVGTPLLWCLGRPRLILPESLIKRLGADRWPGILAHELAHLARRDHWVVRLELLVEAVWWWNPLFWHARRRLHDEAEIACDARVVRSLPERRFAYAEALVDVCEHLARSAIPSPALGVGGAGASHSLEGRLLMILRDPIPRRPSRRGALAALLLSALALPAWTLGQQPEAPRPEAPQAKPEAPPSKPEAPPKAEVPERTVAAPPAEPARPGAAEAAPPLVDPLAAPFKVPRADLTIDDVRAGFAKRRDSLENLAMRYVVASRSESSQGQDGRRVQIEAADVVYGFAPFKDSLTVEGSRLDVFRAVGGLLPKPGETYPADAWTRRLEIRTSGNVKSLRVDPRQKGPVPLHMRGLEPSPTIGNAGFGLLFANDNGLLAGTANASLAAPYRPDLRPLVALDLAGPSPLIVGGVGVQLSGFAVEATGGHQAVRIAWMSNSPGMGGNGESRGLCWLAPGLDFAVVRAEVSIDNPLGPYSSGTKRWLWRKEAGDFARAGDIWLPGKVKTILHEVAPDGQGKAVREQVITLEDYRVNAESIAGAFRANFPIQGLDEKTGDFTTLAPGPVPGLIARLERAVRESPFGPPLDEKATIASKPGLFGSPRDLGLPEARVLPGPNAATPKRAVRPTPPEADPAKIDPGIIASPAPGFEDPIPITEPRKADANPTPNPAPILPPSRPGGKPSNAAPGDLPNPAPGLADPIVEPRKADPIPARAPSDQERLDRQVERRFRLDPEVAALAEQIRQANTKLEDIRRIAPQPGDPSERAAQQKLTRLKTKYDQLWEAKSLAFREDLSEKIDPARDEVDLLQIRLARKAAEVRKVEAQRDMARAVVARNESLRKRNMVSNEEVAKAEGELAVAEAEVAGKLTERDEAELLLNQAKRRLGIATAARPGPPPEEKKPADVRDEMLAADRDRVAHEGREQVGLLQARRDGQAAELQKAEAHREMAEKDMRRAQSLLDRSSMSRQEFDRVATDLKLAEADVARKKADLEEADLLLGQAKRRLGAGPATQPGASGTSTGQAPTLPELRDAVELVEVQLQGKQAELRGAETKAEFAKQQSARAMDPVNREVAMLSAGRAESEVETKKLEVLEFEVRLKQARHRVEVQEAQVKRDLERAKDRLNWSESMFKKGFVSRATFLADRYTYDDLMRQLDPKYVPPQVPATPLER